MKILYILHSGEKTRGTLKSIIEQQGIDNDISLFDLRENKDYKELLEMVEKNDKVISW
ncbi:MAG: hypothetical protein M0Z75_00885 [Nitrospiraceae bacterium]|nr:hypothetical protein [Nitrospiraceae bacterium]